MTSTPAADPRFKALLSTAAIILIIQGLQSAAGVLDPMLMAGVVVICVSPLQRWLRARGLGPGTTMAITATSVVLALLAFGGLLGYAVTALVQLVPRYQDQLAAQLASALAWLDAKGIHASQSKLAEMVSPGRVVALATSFLQGLAGAVSVAVLILMLSIFLMIEAAAFSRGPEATPLLSDDWQRRVDKVMRAVQQYVWITLVTGAMFAAVVWVVMLVLGVDLATLWAVLALLLNFVPGVGFVLSLIPPTALALMEFGPLKAGLVAATFFVANTVTDNVIKPRFMASGLDIGPFVLFVSILFWSYVLGPVGALLAVPLTLAVRYLFIDPA